MVPTTFCLTPPKIIAMFVTPTESNEFDKYDEPRLHMERLMKAKLVEFDLSLRILILLDKAGIKTLGDLVKQTKESLHKISQIGKISVETLENFLVYYGLSLSEKKGCHHDSPGA